MRILDRCTYDKEGYLNEIKKTVIRFKNENTYEHISDITSHFEYLLELIRRLENAVTQMRVICDYEEKCLRCPCCGAKNAQCSKDCELNNLLNELKDE